MRSISILKALILTSIIKNALRNVYEIDSVFSVDLVCKEELNLMLIDYDPGKGSYNMSQPPPTISKQRDLRVSIYM